MVSGVAIAVSFAPEEDCAAFAVHVTDNAEREMLVGAYGLTTGSGIVETLVRAKERGVDVKLIADKTTPCGGQAGSARRRMRVCRSGSTIKRGSPMRRRW